MEWTGQVYADTPAVAAQIYIEAPPERVWRLVSDIFLLPGLSAELQEVAWLGEVAGPAVGQRFTGRNANAALGSWETVSTVVECDEPRCFAWVVGDPGHPSTTWRFSLRPAGAGPEMTGTMLEQWMQMGPGRSGLNLAIDAMPDKEASIVFVRLREMEAGIKHNLAAIKELAEAAR
jgi:uncharacterized protein YndB with AHSA1/START domain